jgi:hypothetical protein
MAAAPKDDAQAADAGRLAGLVRVVKDHPLMLAVSILGTVATFVVGTARVTDLVLGDGGGGGTPIGETVPADEVTLPPSVSYEYARVEDESGRISVEVPTRWGHVRGNGWHATNFPAIPRGRVIGPGLNAAPNVEAWKEDLETPGVFIGASEDILRAYEPEEILQQVSYGGCETADRRSYTNAEYTGAIVTWTCDGGTQWRILAATPTESRGYLVYLQAKLVSDADVEAYNKILNTFQVDFDAT